MARYDRNRNSIKLRRNSQYHCNFFLILGRMFLFLRISIDNHTKVIVGAAVAVGTAAGLAYLYKKNSTEPIPTK